MEASGERRRKVPWYGHPAVIVAGSALCLPLALGFAIAIGRLDGDVLREMREFERAEQGRWVFYLFQVMLGHPWLSLLLGVIVGLPAAMAHKRLLKAHADSYASQYVIPQEELWQWSVVKARFKVGVVTSLPEILGPFVAAGFALLVRVSVIPALFASWFPHVLAYPEYGMIFDLAKTRLEETQRKSSGLPAT